MMKSMKLCDPFGSTAEELYSRASRWWTVASRSACIQESPATTIQFPEHEPIDCSYKLE